MIGGKDVSSLHVTMLERRLASMAKLKAGRLSRELIDACLQYHGGTGFTNEDSPKIRRNHA